MEWVKNKKTMGLLWVTALMVWGMIIYRIANMRLDKNRVVRKDYIPERQVREVKDSLVLHYRDPFLDAPLPAVAAKNANKHTGWEEPSEREISPGIRLTAKIRKGKKDFLVIEHDGTQRLVMLREKVNGYTVMRIFGDTVWLRKGNKEIKIGLYQ